MSRPDAGSSEIHRNFGAGWKTEENFSSGTSNVGCTSSRQILQVLEEFCFCPSVEAAELIEFLSKKSELFPQVFFSLGVFDVFFISVLGS